MPGGIFGGNGTVRDPAGPGAYGSGCGAGHIMKQWSSGVAVSDAKQRTEEWHGGETIRKPWMAGGNCRIPQGVLLKQYVGGLPAL